MMIAGCALAAASPVAAQGRPTSTVSKADASAATRLARLIYPEALNDAIVTYTIVHVVGPAYHADPNLRTLEADRPGIVDAMIAAMRPEFERGRREALPQLWAQTGAVYAAGLTPVELREAVGFYSSATGRRLALAEQRAVAHAEHRSDQVGAQADPAKGLDPDDARARSVFEATATGQKLAALQPQIAAILSAWNDTRTPGADARVGEAMSKAAARFDDPTPRGRLRPSDRKPAK